MKIKIPIRALSVNKAWTNTHKKSADYYQFEHDVCLLLPFNKTRPIEGELFVRYIFFIKNYKASDEDNCKKILQDILVKRGYFIDDKFIKMSMSMKESVKNVLEERIEVDIVHYDDRHVLYI